jgi:uncharacterized protein
MSSAVPNERFEARTEIGATADDLYAWHARPGALQRLQPPWERVEVLEQAGGVRDGARVRLRARVGPVWSEWAVRHEEHEEGRRFCDVLERGPFAYWRHEHRFEPAGTEASVLIDAIDYRLPGGGLGRWVGGGLARSRIQRLFRYRHAITVADLGCWREFSAHRRLRVLVTGARGLIGSALVPFLTTQGHEVVSLSRTAGRGVARWDPATGTIDAAALEGVDAVVHLAGASVAGGRWTDARRREIVGSRVQSTRLLIDALARIGARPRVFASASAIGFHGDTGDSAVDETAAPGAGFLAEVCREWEAEAGRAETLGARTVLLRFGVVLTPAGGALRKMLPAFRAGVGGPVGSGRQWMSWVSIDDALETILRALCEARMSGPVNVVAPVPVRNREFAQTLGAVLGRGAHFRVPAAVLRLAFGRMADETILASGRVEPRKLIDSGHRFRHATLEAALRHVLGR